jgi:hypothetical protein
LETDPVVRFVPAKAFAATNRALRVLKKALLPMKEQ